MDLLKACFMASFDMEAAIPNLLEEALYKTYEVFGWNFRSDSNKFLENREDAWNCGGAYFPTITDYIDVISSVVESKGFNERLHDEYLGSIRARLDSLRTGVKGLMLDTRLSVDFNHLLDGRVILELEGLKSGEDKSFLMGLVLGRLVEALKARHEKEPGYQHITLVEEAHRLLTRIMPGDSPNRKLGVETFADLLAEVRKYGESLIIVDQIPSKLASEALKNTNTKIIHKLFARDDKDAVGDTMALNEKQRNYLSHLLPGEAVVFSQGWEKPVDMQVERLKHVKTDDAEVEKERIFEAGWKYWLENPGLFCPDFPQDCSDLSWLDRDTLRHMASLPEEMLDWLHMRYTPGTSGEMPEDTLTKRAALFLEARKKIFTNFETSFARQFFRSVLHSAWHRSLMKKYAGMVHVKAEVEAAMKEIPRMMENCLSADTAEKAEKAIGNSICLF
ncbi:MAG: hypothetical protein CSB33_01125 [Desulfobacterales bacterium]|nr:MAG: hypothetical protein CSB33_01125 [Desulfobacterales bacterium]